MASSGDHDYDVIVIGAGISGINAGYRIQHMLPDHKYAILEARGGIGGTWDLFKYPGIRSDSDLHTFGFPWQPWTEQKAIADGESIKQYIKATASQHGITDHIQFHRQVSTANWSTEQQHWQLDVLVNEEKQVRYNARYVIWASGYYDYKTPLATTVNGLENFKGTTIHPQFWPSDLDYANKHVVIVGSGATAVTLLPVLAKTAAHVTMLQRSPGYLITMPQNDPTEQFLRKILPTWLLHKILRLKWLTVPWLFLNFCRTFPNAARSVMRARTQKELPKNVPHDPHFEPAYTPWQQRLCVCPDGDFFQCLHHGKAGVATGVIDTMTEDAIILKSGQRIKADIIVTATGLKVQLIGGANLTVDGSTIHPGQKYFWKGLLLQDVPNSAFVVGYTNASWTLGADATAQHFCRIIKTMEGRGETAVVPRLEDSSTPKELPLLNLNSTYVQKGEGTLPKAASTAPWKPRANYFSDLWEAKMGNISTGLEYQKIDILSNDPLHEWRTWCQVRSLQKICTRATLAIIALQFAIRYTMRTIGRACARSPREEYLLGQFTLMAGLDRANEWDPLELVTADSYVKMADFLEYGVLERSLNLGKLVGGVLDQIDQVLVREHELRVPL